MENSKKKQNVTCKNNNYQNKNATGGCAQYAVELVKCEGWEKICDSQACGEKSLQTLQCVA
ncbi:hypothetical protein T4C_5315 [Trichinella pseudospiralis]|uniref:Uncharacterized protein n=1 Tax=Trichinella pseudospiralis TaxID=6337 RepID=A0A0V1K1C6_TRIPS|nr:hypothetical protein T4C_5315 [Trichinella pseudospiralis]